LQPQVTPAPDAGSVYLRNLVYIQHRNSESEPAREWLVEVLGVVSILAPSALCAVFGGSSSSGGVVEAAIIRDLTSPTSSVVPFGQNALVPSCHYVAASETFGVIDPRSIIRAAVAVPEFVRSGADEPATAGVRSDVVAASKGTGKRRSLQRFYAMKPLV
jgi:hypothetical protein